MNRLITHDLRHTAGIQIVFWLLLFVVSCTSFVSSASAQAPAPAPTEYTLLAPIPLQGAGGNPTEKTNAVQYITGLFKLIIGLAGVLAVVMLIYAGIKYMSTDAFSGKDEAKGVIENAMWGLGLAIAAWLILYTINPKLVEIKFDIPKHKIAPSSLSGGGGGGGVLPGYILTPEQVAEDNRIELDLKKNIPSVTINNNPCVTGATSGCTNVVGLPQQAIEGVKSFALTCQIAMGKNCFVEITGGTEGGHATHGPGLAVIDIGKNLNVNNYIKQKGAPTNTQACSQLGPQYSLNNTIYVDEWTHWHVCY